MRIRDRGERGAAAVEFALVLPVLLMIVLGTIDWGWYFFVSQVVTNAAREGARVGSLTAYDPDDSGKDAAAVLEAEATATAYLKNAKLPKAATATVTAAPVGNAIRVTVSYPAGSLTGFTRLIPIIPEQSQALAEMRR
jgi:Flp pilus assembly protein TadG